MKISCISDTHWIVKDEYELQLLTDLLPGGIFLVHAGDMSGRGTITEIRMFLEWFNKLPYTYKILIAGNHDFFFERAHVNIIQELLAEYPDIIYLKNSGITIEGIKFWGSPITPYFQNWAFNRFHNEIGKYWDMIPNDIDVLITHGPPYKILDKTTDTQDHVGCQLLLDKIKLIKPKVHVFGHIHEGRGLIEIDGTTFINASVVNVQYRLYGDFIYTINVEPNENNLV